MSTSLISSLTWIPRGRASTHPKKYEFNESELERVGKMGGEGVLEKLREEMEGMKVGKDVDEGEDDEGEWESDGTSSETSQDKDGDATMQDTDAPSKPSDLTDLSAYNLDDYDEEESRGTAMGAFSNIKGLSVFQDNNDDPYITLKDDAEDEEAEREALSILPTDSLLLTSRTSDDLSSLEYHVYDEPNENLYVHHDLMLPSFPVCVEWLDFPCGGPSSSSSSTSSTSATPADQNANDGTKKTHGNYIAVGTFDPSIEIWDMDLLDGLYPEAILGPPVSTLPSDDPRNQPKKKGTGKKKRRLLETDPNHHVSSVTCLSWSPHHRNLLLSGSADHTIKLWDLTRESPQSAIKSYDSVHPGEKILGIEWNKFPGGEHSTVVLSAGERTVKVWDTRAVEGAVGTGALGSDVESIRWDPWNAMDFFVSLENGLILCYDARTLSSSSNPKSTPPRPKYTISAHDGPATALDINPHMRGCIATGGLDSKLKIWNVNEEVEGRREVSLVTSRDLGVGKVFTLRWSPDTPLTLAAAGSAARLQIWDTGSNAAVRQAFGSRLKQAGKELAERKEEKGGNGGLIGVADDDEGDSDEE